MSADLLRAARGYIQLLGFELVVCDARKLPVTQWFPHGVSSATQDIALIEQAIRWTVAPTLAARVGHRLVIDVDTRSDGPDTLASLLRTHGPLPTTWTQRTPTGGTHYFFTGLPPGEWKGHLGPGIDVLRQNRYVLVSPSQRQGGRYEWTTHPLRSELARAPQWLISGLRIEPTRDNVSPETPRVADIELRVRRARAWLEHADIAVSGQHGHGRTFAVCGVVTRGFDLDEDDAYQVLLEWNERCDPPWSERELRRKIKEAREKSDVRRGAKLEPQP